MSKFVAWAASPTTNTHGIRLQVAAADVNQYRQEVYMDYQDSEYPAINADVSTTLYTPEGSWVKNYLYDQNPGSAWSSKGHTTADEKEWFAFWWGPTVRINAIRLYPRSENDAIYCFPEKVSIFYSKATGVWELIEEDIYLSSPSDPSSPIIIPLPRAIDTDGFMIKASTLRPDQFGNFYFQMAGASGFYRQMSIDSSKVRQYAELHPNSLFFLNDEPDLYISPDEYAAGYSAFVDAVKSGSNQAKVSPAGIILPSRSDRINFGLHGVQYAKAIRNATDAPIDEWRFHDFFRADRTDLEQRWKKNINEAAAWAKDQGVSIVLGSFLGPLATMPDAMAFLKSHDRIVEAAWWSYFWHELEASSLVKKVDGELTDAGKVFVQSM
jgi:hypothetical protein